MFDAWRKALPYIKPLLPESAPVDLHLSADDSPVIRNLNNGLLVMYLVDKGDRYEYVQGRDLRESGAELQALDLIATQNLREYTRGRMRLQSRRNVNIVLLDGNLESSTLVLDEVWDGWTNLAPNGFVVAVPARDALAFSDARCAAGVTLLRDIVSRVTAAGDHLISTSLYRRCGTEWVTEGDAKSS